MVKKIVKDSKENSKKNVLLNLILKEIATGLNISQIATKYNTSKQRLNPYVADLKKRNLIESTTKGVWKLKENGKKILKGIEESFTILDKPTTNLHALEITFPILDGKIKDNDWEIKNKLNNWLPKYKKLDALQGLTIRNNNNKSISVFAHARDIKDLSEVSNLMFKIRQYVYEYFYYKHQVVLDLFNCETKNLDLATEDKPAEEMRGKGEKFVLDLNKTAEKVYPSDRMRARALIDGSPFNFSAETNDLEWKREYLRMPFSIRDLSHSMPVVKEYTKHIKLHMDVQKSQLKTQQDTQKLLKEMSRYFQKEKRKVRQKKEEQRTLF